MRRRPNLLPVALGCALLAAPAFAQAPRPASVADALFDVQKAAFAALPEATRVAIQQALVWLGFYSGVADGVFGKGTRDAIVAWQTSARATVDGVIGPSLLRAVLAAGDKARDAAGFRMVDDPKTGARVGSPVKLLPRGAKLAFVSEASGDLSGLYARLSADSPSRKVAYKAIKPDVFFVVSGQEGATKFYARYEKNPTATPPIRGFVFSYPAQAATEFDRVAIAVANSYVGFPTSGAAAPAAPPAPAPTATALVIGHGRALTALRPAGCANPTIGGKPVRVERADPSGLVVLAGDFGVAADPPGLAKPEGDLIALSAGGERITAAPAAFARKAGRPLAVASLDAGGGAPLFTRDGRLAGLVAPDSAEPRRVGGVALATPHAIIDADAIGAFLGGGAIEAVPAAPLAAGAIAAREKGRIVPVFCGE